MTRVFSMRPRGSSTTRGPSRSSCADGGRRDREAWSSSSARSTPGSAAGTASCSGGTRPSAWAFSGTYTEIVPGRRVVRTQLFEPIPEAGEAIVTATFEETEGRTRFVLHQLYPSKQSLDGALASGMEPGMRETYEQLESLVAELR